MTTSKLKRLAIPTALVVGGVTAGSFLAPIGLASAQESDSDTPDTDETDADVTVDEETEGTEDDHHHRGRHGRGKGGVFRGGLDTLEETLGLSAEEIRAGFAEGKTLADLAAEQGVSTDALADALVAQATERIDAAVADGKIDEDRAATAKENLEDRIDAAIEAEPFALGRGIGRAESRGLRHHHRHHHHGDDADADSGGSDDDGEVVESSLVDA